MLLSRSYPISRHFLLTITLMDKANTLNGASGVSGLNSFQLSTLT